MAPFARVNEFVLGRARALFGPFGPRGPAGRGLVRQVLRERAVLWGQDTVACLPTEEVLFLLERCPFLFEERFAWVRASLVAQVDSGDSSRLSVALPARVVREVMGEDPVLELERACELLVSEPFERCVSANARQPRGPRRSLGTIQGAFSRGHFERVLKDVRERETEASVTERLFEVHALIELGRLRAARRGLLSLRRTFHSGELGGGDTDRELDLAESEIRCLANLGQLKQLRSVLDRLEELMVRGGLSAKQQVRASLLAALAHWDLEQFDGMERSLEVARRWGARWFASSTRVAGTRSDSEVLPESPCETSWSLLCARFHQASGLFALKRSDNELARSHFEVALYVLPRHAPRTRRARLFNELALGRTATGELHAAERAAHSAYRLFERTDSQAGVTLALNNLAEIQVRRGRVGTARVLLEHAARTNREAGNLRGESYDRCLAARLALAEGSFEQALAELMGASQTLRAASHGEWSALEIRARLLVGQREWAARAISKQDQESNQRGTRWYLAFEPEERPAIYLQAGLRSRAVEVAEEQRPGIRELWLTCLLHGTPDRTLRQFHSLADLGPDRFRTARLVYDLYWASCLEQDPVHARNLRPTSSLRVEAALVLFEVGWHRAAADLATCQGQALEPSFPEAADLVFEAPRPDPEPPGSDPTLDMGPFVGRSPELVDCVALLEGFARTEVPVLIQGETGTGKELAAQLVHQRSTRKDMPLVVANCAAFEESLLSAELFGHSRGAFTGADRERAGLIVEAHRGVLFLDEIGDLPLLAQGKLLRVLQEGEVRAVGRDRARSVDVRVLAATHRNLEQMVEAGTFREDLYFRLKVARVVMPPLRDRLSDLRALVAHALRETPGAFEPEVDESVLSLLECHTWPGNVRELFGVVWAAAARASVRGADALEPCDLEPGLLTSLQSVTSVSADGEGKEGDENAGASRDGVGYHQLVYDFRQQLVRNALEAACGNRAEAARSLGVTRQALSYLIKTLDLS